MAPAIKVATPQNVVRFPVASAVERYVAEREAKRAQGIADILPHTAFDGRPGEFVFVGRRNVGGQALTLLSDSSKIIVLLAQEHDAKLRNGERVTLTAAGRVIGRGQGRGR